MSTFVRRGAVLAALVLAVLSLARPTQGAQPTRTVAPPNAQTARPAAPPQAEVPPPGASEIRGELRDVLNTYSPTVGRVLAMDFSLLQNPSYLEPYPKLAAFLRDHPEVVRDPAYFLVDYRAASQLYIRPDRESQEFRMWSSFLSGIAIFAVFLTVTFSLAWVVRTLVDYRRWVRLSKVQTEAHNKLLDRFTANEDLLTYVSTPSGKRFLESAPLALDPSAPSIGAPVRRILWAIEVGLVVVCGGGGLLVANRLAPAELSQLLRVVGIFAISLGGGFILSAAASYMLSSRLGLLTNATPRDGRDAGAPPVA
jgi:hypothetical protein